MKRYHRFAKHSEETKRMNEEMLQKCPKLKRVTPKDNLIKNLRKRGVTVLDESKAAPTVTAHPDDFVHYCEPRILTVRESARIQSFPDSFICRTNRKCFNGDDEKWNYRIGKIYNLELVRH